MIINILVGGPHTELPKNFWNEIVIKNNNWVGADKGAVDLVKHSKKLLFAIGDFDSSNETEFNSVRDNVEDLIIFEPEKDYTDTELAVKTVIEKYKPERINIYGATGGRIDHLLANIMFVLKPEFRKYANSIRIIDRNNDITFFLPGKYKIEKIAKMKYLAFIPLEKIEKLYLYDEKYTLKNANYDYPISLASNEFLDNTGNFSFEKGMLCVIQSKDL